MSIQNELQIEYLSPNSIDDYHRQLRTIPEPQITKAQKIIEECGFALPALINKDNILLHGHPFVEAARRMKIESVPVIRHEHLSAEQERVLRIALNRITEEAEWNKEMIALELSELQILIPDPSITGFDPNEISLILDILPEENTDDDITAFMDGPPVVKKGDKWILGNHSLYNGDALEEKSYQILMEGEKAQMCFTDSPYNVKIDGHVGNSGKTKHREFVEASGEMNPEQFTSFLEKPHKHMATHSEDGAIIFSCMDWRHIREIMDAARNANLSMINFCCWVKDNGGMGGFPPLGYQRLDKKLIPHPKEQQDVEYIFQQYLKLGSVRKLAEDLHKNKYRTPVRISKKDREYGGCVYSRGHLYKILSNPIYIGQVRHKDQIYDGQHDAIITSDLYTQVQQQLKTQAPDTKNKTVPSGSLLQGLLYDCDNIIYSPTYTAKKGKRYSYYISQNLIQYRDHPKGIMARIPAHEIEKSVTNAIQEWLQNPEMWQGAFPNTSEDHLSWVTQNLIPVRSRFIKNIINRVVVNTDVLDIQIDSETLRKEVLQHSEISINTPANKEIIITAPFKSNRGKNGAIIIESQNSENKDLLDLPADKLKRIVRGIIWRDEHFAGETITSIGKRTTHGENYVNNCIQESFKFLSQ